LGHGHQPWKPSWTRQSAVWADGLSFGGYEQQSKTIAAYRRRIRNCAPVGTYVNEQVITTNFLFCHQDIKYAAAAGQRFAEGYRYMAAQNVFMRKVYPPHGLMRAPRKELAGILRKLTITSNSCYVSFRGWCADREPRRRREFQ